MPTYEYHCDSCDRDFDVVQSFHDDPLETCPTCGSPVRKVFGNVGIVFKGSGFYKTDSRKPAAAKTGDGASASGSDGATSDGAASDGAGSDRGASSGTGDTSAPATTPDKKEAASPSPTKPSSGNGKASSSKESSKT